jgi:hydrophobic/amphiphilic exporter-1 (mainly G- bacteria), HAE1 family
MSISEPFVRRPIATSLLMGGIFLVGLVVFPLLPVAPLPQVDFPTISVSASLPGGDPATMASSVATPLETQFAQISGLSQMTSTNALGTTQITLQFDLDRSIDAAAQDVQAGIDAARAQLPTNLPTPPTYRKVNPADSPILLLSVHSDVLPVTTVDDYAENILAQQISQIPGVAQVSIGGQQKPAVRVQIDPTKLAALGLQMEDVAGVIATATVDAPKGSINGPTRSMTIYDNDQLLKAEPWNDVVVAYKNGGAVRIRDIGVAVDGPENRLISAWQNGRKGILLHIAAHLQAARSQCHRRGEARASAAAACARLHAALGQGGHGGQSHHDHQGFGGGCGSHPVDHHRAGGAGDISVFAQPLGHHHPGRHGAVGAARHHRVDVHLELQPGQPVLDGAHHRGRVRRR